MSTIPDSKEKLKIVNKIFGKSSIQWWCFAVVTYGDSENKPECIEEFLDDIIREKFLRIEKKDFEDDYDREKYFYAKETVKFEMYNFKDEMSMKSGMKLYRDLKKTLFYNEETDTEIYDIDRLYSLLQ